jgi:hypothetical protein
MPVLPLIDLMILVAWSSLIVAFVEKSLELALARHYYLFGIGPFDWVVIACAALLFAISLAARTWVKSMEGALSLRIPKTGVEVLPDFPDPRTQQGIAAARQAPQDVAPTRLAAR